MRALIVDRDASRGGLAGIRGLAAAGWEVGVASPTSTELAAWSRYCRHRHRIRDPLGDPSGFVDSVAAAVQSYDYSVVFATGDAGLLLLSDARDRLTCAFPHPDQGRLRTLLDKRRLAEQAAAVGLRTPSATEGLPGPGAYVVIKSAVHSNPGPVGSPRWEALVTGDRAEAVARLEAMRAAGVEPIVQEAIVGSLMAVVVVIDRDGGVVARLQQEAEAIWPVGAGISVRARTVSPDEELCGRVEDLLASIGWWGLAEAQFLRTSSGAQVLIDVNGRFYGSMALALASGVNLPALSAAVALGENVPRGLEGRPGTRYQWFEGDLRRAASERHGGLIRDLAGTCAYALGARHSIWSWRDPVPAIRYAGHLTVRALKKALR